MGVMVGEIVGVIVDETKGVENILTVEIEGEEVDWPKLTGVFMKEGEHA